MLNYDPHIINNIQEGFVPEKSGKYYALCLHYANKVLCQIKGLPDHAHPSPSIFVGCGVRSIQSIQAHRVSFRWIPPSSPTGMLGCVESIHQIQAQRPLPSLLPLDLMLGGVLKFPISDAGI